VSNNNSATANVLEKLEKYGVDFIAAYLGNRENKEKFLVGQTQTYPDMSFLFTDCGILKNNPHIRMKSLKTNRTLLFQFANIYILRNVFECFSISLSMILIQYPL